MQYHDRGARALHREPPVPVDHPCVCWNEPNIEVDGERRERAHGRRPPSRCSPLCRTLMPDHVRALSAREIARTVSAGQTSARETVSEALADLAEHDPIYAAFTAIEAELALAAADEVDRRIASGTRLALAGVPVAVKELVSVAGLPRGYGTVAMPRERSVRDAECVRRLRAAGAVPVGVTRTSELAWRDDTPPTRNPLDRRLSCGGSSGGSAVAVAAGLVPIALGTDTGGSIRYPAALCGCCGFKPSYGAVPLDGVLPVAPSLDHVGPLARTIDDLTLTFAALVGGPPAGARATRRPRPRLGIARDAAGRVADPQLVTALAALCETLVGEAVADLEAVAQPPFAIGYDVVETISLAEGAAVFADVLAAPVGAVSARSRAELAAAPPPGSTRCRRARAARVAVRQQMAQLFDAHDLDALLLPALPGAAPYRDGPRGQEPASSLFPLANATGQPACVVPFRRRRSPLALQLLGRCGADFELLTIAAAVEAIACDL